MTNDLEKENAYNFFQQAVQTIRSAAGPVLAWAVVTGVGALTGLSYNYARLDERVSAIEAVDAATYSRVIEHENEIHQLQRDCRTNWTVFEGRISWLEAINGRGD